MTRISRAGTLCVAAPGTLACLQVEVGVGVISTVVNFDYLGDESVRYRGIVFVREDRDDMQTVSPLCKRDHCALTT